MQTRMALFFAVVLGITGLCVLAVYHQSPEPREKFRRRNFDRTVAEGMRLWNPKAGVDSVRFDACRIENKREVPVFAADEAKNRGRTLELKNCRVFAEDGSTNSVGVARLMVQPAPALVWEGGMRKLDDLLPNSSAEGKEK